MRSIAPPKPRKAQCSLSTVVLRVPEPAFDEVLRSLRKLGTLREENTTGQDLTEEFVDTEARLRALRKLEARLVSSQGRSEHPQCK